MRMAVPPEQRMQQAWLAVERVRPSLCRSSATQDVRAILLGGRWPSKCWSKQSRQRERSMRCTTPVALRPAGAGGAGGGPHEAVMRAQPQRLRLWGCCGGAGFSACSCRQAGRPGRQAPCQARGQADSRSAHTRPDRTLLLQAKSAPSLCKAAHCPPVAASPSNKQRPAGQGILESAFLHRFCGAAPARRG